MSPKLAQIRMFVAVFEELSFTAAAVREGVGQSAASDHIRRLEEQCGVQLFNRTRTVSPTPAGHAYYAHSIDLLRKHAKLCQPTELKKHGLSGTVRIGLVPPLTLSIASQALLRFEYDHPGVSIDVVEGHSMMIIDAVQSERLDAGIVQQSANPLRGLRSSAFLSSPAFLVSSAASPLVHGEPVQLQKVLQSGMARLRAPKAGSRAQLEQYLLNHRINVTPWDEPLLSLLGQLDLVRTSNWSLLAPGVMLSSELHGTDFTLNPLNSPPLWEDSILIELNRKPLGSAGQAFVEVLRQIADQENEVSIRLLHGEPMVSFLESKSVPVETVP